MQRLQADGRGDTGAIITQRAPDDLVERFGADGPPGVVLVHGGYWRPRVDRGYLRPMASRLADELAPSNRSVWLIEYPRRPGDPDAAVQALQRVRAQSGDAVWVGHSAGGHLALLTAGAAGCVSLGGLTDLERAADARLSNDAAAEFTGQTWDPRWVPGSESVPDNAFRQLNPTRHGFGEHTLLLHGDADQAVPVEFSRDAAAWSGTPVRYRELTGAHHFDPVDPRSPYFPEVAEAIVALSRSTAAANSDTTRSGGQ